MTRNMAAVIGIGCAAVGLGLTIGGVFAPPLLPIGGAILAASVAAIIAIIQKNKNQKNHNVPRETDANPIPENTVCEHSRGESVNIQNNLFFVYGGPDYVGRRDSIQSDNSIQSANKQMITLV